MCQVRAKLPLLLELSPLNLFCLHYGLLPFQFFDVSRLRPQLCDLCRRRQKLQFLLAWASLHQWQLRGLLSQLLNLHKLYLLCDMQPWICCREWQLQGVRIVLL